MSSRLQKRVVGNAVIDYISVDYDYIYGYNIYYRNISRWDRNGSNMQTIVSNISLSSISSDGKYIYGSNSDNKLIFRWNKSGTNQTTIDIKSSAYGIVVTNNYIYGIQSGSIHRWTNNSTDVQHNIVGYGLSILSICADEQYIYAASSNTIYKLNPDGSKLDFFVIGTNIASNIVSGSGHLYSVLSNGNMYRMSEGSIDSKALINNTGTINMASLQNSPYIYWASIDGVYELNTIGTMIPCGDNSLHYMPTRLFRRCSNPFYNQNNILRPLGTFSIIMIVIGVVLFVVFCTLVRYRIRKRKHRLNPETNLDKIRTKNKDHISLLIK